MVRDQRADLPDDGMARARACPLPPVRAFVAGLELALAAVRAGLSLPWRQGPVEGVIRCPKPVKRQSCDRVSIAHVRIGLLTGA